MTRCTLDDARIIDQVADPLVGRQLDRYHIEERLGVGGMGCVYSARHAIIDRSYAIKVLFGDYANNEKFQARFRREATSISKIR
ncbi:MAG: serine/threonine protein kinase, partial [Myxococcota bacterium]